MPHATPQRILLIGPDDGLRACLHAAGFEVLVIEADADLYATVDSLQPDAVLLGADSPSRDTLEHLATLSRRFPQPSLLLQGAKNPELTQEAMRLGISAYVTEGLSPAAVRSLIEVSMAHAQQLHALRRELARKQKSIAERNQVDEAKRLLWKQHGMSEEAAYQALRNHAMNKRCSVAEAARRLIESKQQDQEPQS